MVCGRHLVVLVGNYEKGSAVKGCNIQTIKLDTILSEQEVGSVDMRVIDFYGDGNWTIRFGDYGHMYEAKATTENIELLVSVLSAMLIDREEVMAAESGDANTPWLDTVQEEDHKVEAWLDMEG